MGKKKRYMFSPKFADHPLSRLGNDTTNTENTTTTTIIEETTTTNIVEETVTTLPTPEPIIKPEPTVTKKVSTPITTPAKETTTTTTPTPTKKTKTSTGRGTPSKRTTTRPGTKKTRK